MKPKSNQRLKQERERRGWSQAKLAEEVGIDSTTVSRWERGLSLPYPYYREKLCTLFGKTVQELELLPCDEKSEEPEACPLPAGTVTPVHDPVYLGLAKESEEVISREEHLQALRQHVFEANKHASVALYGLPGVGKTTLASSLAHERDVVASFPDGVLWAGLGPTPNVLGHLSRWAILLGLDASRLAQEKDIHAWAHALYTAIGTRRLLLVIDDAWTQEDAFLLKVGGPNCAHLLTTRFPQLAISFAPHGAVLLPELSEQESITLLAHLAPIMLQEGLETLKPLVQAAGGLPLALRLIGNSVQQQAYNGQTRRIQSALLRLHDVKERFLLQEFQGVLDRHTSLSQGTPLSLQSVIAVSDQYLDPQTRAALRRLAVFPAKPNSFSEEAALAVCALPASTLDALCDAGLLESCTQNRYSMHQTIADYACLQRTETRGASHRLVRYMVQYIETHQNEYEILDVERTNILAALKRALELAMHAEIVRGVNAVSGFLRDRGLHELAQEYLQHAYHSARVLGGVRCQTVTLLQIGKIAMMAGDYSRASSALHEGLALARQHAEREQMMLLLTQLAALTRSRGDYEQAEKYCQEGLVLAYESNAIEGIGELLNGLGLIVYECGNPLQAEHYFHEALTFAHHMKGRQRIDVLLNLGLCLFQRGDSERTEEYFRQGLTLAKAIGDTEKTALLLGNLSEWEYLQGAKEQAERDCREALTLTRQIQYPEFTSYLLGRLGYMAGDQGAYTRAERYYQEAFALVRQIGKHWLLSALLNDWGEIQFKHHQIEEAKKILCEAVEHVPDGNQEMKATLFYNLARVHAAQNNWEEARCLGERSISMFESMKHRMVPEVRQWLNSLLVISSEDNEKNGKGE